MKRPEPAPAAPPAPAAESPPRRSLAVSVDLPDPEFPATYHTTSLRQVARETPRLVASPREVPIEAPRPALLPRLSRLLWGSTPEQAK